jgi:uncharacterized SAM-binding protein YcdF (DUF218 family)
MTKLISLLVSPLGTAIVLALAAAAFAWRRRTRCAWSAATIAIAWLWLWSTPMASLWLRGIVESAYPAVPVATLPAADAIVVLGGTVDPPRGRRLEVDLKLGADRVWHAARIYRAGKAPLILLSGGSEPGLGMMSEAAAMQVFLRDLGVPDAAMLLEERSRNTHENAVDSAEILKARGISRILLVTSALHMRRAVLEFEGQGLTVVPATTDVEAVAMPLTLMRLLPDADALAGSGRGFKELVGTVGRCQVCKMRKMDEAVH